MQRPPILPEAPKSIEKGVPLKQLIGQEAIECLALNIDYVSPGFEVEKFCHSALEGIDELSLMQRAKKVALNLQTFLPSNYSEAVKVLLNSMTAEASSSEEFGLSGFFYLPYSFFISEFGQNKALNGGQDPFSVSMNAMYELTKRFTAEFAIRNFLIEQQKRTLGQLSEWVKDENAHVRRLSSEGTRPKLPWGKRLKSFIENPQLTLPILEALKNDESLYVRRSVANHLGDIAKDHPQIVFDICQRWLDEGASKELKWVIRHAVRYPAKKSNPGALELRILAKA